MIDRIQYAESKEPRTKSWTSNPAYDKFLSEVDFSGLKLLLQVNYTNKERLRKHCDIHSKEIYDEYMKYENKIGMIKNEMYNRYMDISASPSYRLGDSDYFDANTGCVVSYQYDCKNNLYDIYFSENEDSLIYHDDDANIYMFFDTDTSEYSEVDRNVLYLQWNYTKELEEDGTEEDNL